MHRSDFRNVITPADTLVQALAPASTRVAILFAAPSRASDGTVQQYMVLPGGPAGLAALQQQGLIIESGASLLITRELFGDAITAAWYAASPGTTGPGAIAILQSFNDAPPPRTGG